jgi:hypothetical protein
MSKKMFQLLGFWNIKEVEIEQKNLAVQVLKFHQSMSRSKISTRFFNSKNSYQTIFHFNVQLEV